MYGLHVAADLDTVMYTLAGVEGPHGWGRRDDTFAVMDALADLGVDTSFRLGDRDLANCLQRTNALAAGIPLSSYTSDLAATMGVSARVLPATDDPLRTMVLTDDGWLPFQEYFVLRRHRDPVRDLRFEGAEAARPAPGLVASIAEAGAVVIAPSNPLLSVWPILAIPAIREAVAAKPVVVAISPLFDGQALKGPAATVMADQGLPPGNEGVLAAYEGVATHLVVDVGDTGDVETLESEAMRVSALDTRISEPAEGARLTNELMGLIREAHSAPPVR
jgi:LPPG:FO 2-phospho-L-lactate transferase